jgi:hypothetical protein
VGGPLTSILLARAGTAVTPPTKQITSTDDRIGAFAAFVRTRTPLLISSPSPNIQRNEPVVSPFLGATLCEDGSYSADTAESPIIPSECYVGPYNKSIALEG